jgi:hypothetical protein
MLECLVGDDARLFADGSASCGLAVVGTLRYRHSIDIGELRESFGVHAYVARARLILRRRASPQVGTRYGLRLLSRRWPARQVDEHNRSSQGPTHGQGVLAVTGTVRAHRHSMSTSIALQGSRQALRVAKSTNEISFTESKLRAEAKGTRWNWIEAEILRDAPEKLERLVMGIFGLRRSVCPVRRNRKARGQ